VVEVDMRRSGHKNEGYVSMALKKKASKVPETN
jgi:hypothetical protein